MQESNKLISHASIKRYKMEQKQLQEKQRKRWSREETMAFLRCYQARKSEFDHVKKKRLAYANVLKDMEPMAVMDYERTPICLESKMRSLLQAYKAALENNGSSSPCFAPYMELMDEIFGSDPIVFNSHLTPDVGRRLGHSRQMSVTSDPLESSQSPSASRSPSPSYSESECGQKQATSLITDSSSPTPSSLLVARKKRSARQLYYEKKFQLRKLTAEQKKNAMSKAIEELKIMLQDKKCQKDNEPACENSLEYIVDEYDVPPNAYDTNCSAQNISESMQCIKEEPEVSFAYNNDILDQSEPSTSAFDESSSFNKQTMNATAMEESFKKFMDKMAAMHENHTKAAGKHDAFFQLVSSKLDVLSTEDQEDAKMFFLNHLHQMSKAKKNVA